MAALLWPPSFSNFLCTLYHLHASACNPSAHHKPACPTHASFSVCLHPHHLPSTTQHTATAPQAFARCLLRHCYPAACNSNSTTRILLTSTCLLRCCCYYLRLLLDVPSAFPLRTTTHLRTGLLRPAPHGGTATPPHYRRATNAALAGEDAAPPGLGMEGWVYRKRNSCMPCLSPSPKHSNAGGATAGMTGRHASPVLA